MFKYRPHILKSGLWFSIVNAILHRINYPAYFRHPYLVSGKKIWLYERRGSSDGQVYWQVIISEEYARIRDLDTPDWIIDGGANVGYSSAYFSNQFPDAKIIAVEPDKDNHRLLTRNVKSISNIITLNAALWSHETALSMAPEVFRDGKDWSKHVSDVPGTVAAYSVNDLITMYQITGTLFVKLDVEGAETVIFGSDKLDWVSQSNAVLIELHPDSPFGDPSQIVFDRLKTLGFSYTETNEGYMFYR